ncbi:MAG: DUF1559 domain-containing protein [Pirellulales bacterium]
MRCVTVLTAVLRARPLIAGFAIVLAATGCPDLSSRDMAKYAIKGRGDNDDDEVPKPTPPTNSAPATPPAATPPASKAPPANQAASAPASSASQSVGTKTPPQGSSLPAPSAPADSTTPLPAAASLTDRLPMPTEPWGEAQRMSHSADNLRKLGEAVEKYRQQFNVYPPRAIFSSSGEPLLSWRVALLPYLGYQQLYDQFHLNEPWDSTHNRQLLELIPKVYQSPERWNNATNYLAPVGASTLFNGDHGTHPRRIEDGLDHTVVFIEADDDGAVPWTEPRDWDFDPLQPARQIGSLRHKGFLSVWANGSVRFVNRAASSTQLKALFTVDGGEELQVNQISQSAEAALAKLGGAQIASGDLTTNRPDTATNGQADTNPPAGGVPLQPVAGEELRELASTLLQQGDENRAAQVYFAWLLTQPPKGPWVDEFRWSPLLKRPVSLQRIGIGVDFSGRASLEARTLLAQANQKIGSSGNSPRELGTDLLRKLLGSAGPDLVRICTPELIQHPRWMNIGPEGSAPTTVNKPADLYQPLRLGPGLELLGVDSTERLLRLCDRAAVDVALIVQLRDPPGGKSQLRAMRVTVWDVAGRRELHRTRPVKAADRMAAQLDALRDDPWPPIRDELGGWLAENLKTEPLPASLRPEHIRKRAERLAAKPKEQPLAALAELKLYHAKGLLDLEQLLKSCQQLTDEPTGLTLVAGDTAARQAALQRWLAPAPSQDDVLQVSRERDDG